jgi:hypothetical protein
MDIQAEKYQLIQQMIHIDDESLIRKIKAIIGNQVSGLTQPMSIEEFYERIEDSEKALADGNYISHED